MRPGIGTKWTAVGLALTLLYSTVALPSSASALPSPGAISETDLLPHAPESSTWLEYWAFILRTDAGHTIYCQFLVAKVGILTSRSAVMANITTPDGQVKVFSQEFEREDLSFREDTRQLQLGKSYIAFRGKQIDLYLGTSQFTLDATLEPLAAGFKLGDGKTSIGSRNFLTTFYQVPVGKLTGTLRLSKGGKGERLTGYGSMDHGVSDILQPAFSDKWFTFHAMSGEQAIAVNDMRFNSKFKSERRPLLYVWQKGELVCATEEYKLTPKSEQKFAGHSRMLPSGFVLDGVCAGQRISLDVRSTQLHEVYDVLGNLSGLVRKVASLVAGELTFYRFNNDYTFKLGTTVTTGKGLNEILDMN